MTRMDDYLRSVFHAQRIVIADCTRFADLHFFDTDGYRPYRVLAPSLGNGFGGYLVGFSRYLDRSDIENMARRLHRSAHALNTLGFMTGYGGLYAVAGNLRRLGYSTDPALDQLLDTLPVKAWISNSVERRGLWRTLDFFDGLAGYCFGVASFGTAHQITQQRPTFEIFADLLQGAMDRRSVYDAPTPGFSHGFTGYAHALLAIFAATADSRFRDLADFFREEAHRGFGLTRQADGTAEVAPAEAQVYSMFCNGHVGLALHEGYRHSILGDGQPLRCAPLSHLLLDTTYCHGTPSLLAALDAGWLVTDDPDLRRSVEDAHHRNLDDLYANKRTLLANLTWNYGALGLFSESKDFGGLSLTQVLNGKLAARQPNLMSVA